MRSTSHPNLDLRFFVFFFFFSENERLLNLNPKSWRWMVHIMMFRISMGSDFFVNLSPMIF